MLEPINIYSIYNTNKILFIDRDGVINKDPNGYFIDYSKIEYNYDILEKIKEEFKSYIKIIVTNQSGIARGYYTELEFLRLMENMLGDLSKMGIEISDVYYAPSLPENNDYNRKPNPGMLIKGLEKYNADPKFCIMIGDKESDREAAKNANLGKFILYKEE